MIRLTPRLQLMVAALLLAGAWVVVPVSTSPTPEAQAPRAVPVPAVPVAPQLEALDRELERLRDRVVEPVTAPVASRDPFQFAPERDVPHGFVSEPSVAESQPPAVAWPPVVAILRSGSDSAPTMRVALEDGSQVVHFRSAGDTIGDVVVTAITAETVTLTHTPSGQSTTVTLR
jgi:hypothetical protein